MDELVEPDVSDFLPSTYGPPCTVGVALARLTPERRETIEAAMRHPGTIMRKIAARLAEWSEMNVRPDAVSRHKRGDCRCGK